MYKVVEVYRERYGTVDGVGKFRFGGGIWRLILMGKSYGEEVVVCMLKGSGENSICSFDIYRDL